MNARRLLTVGLAGTALVLSAAAGAHAEDGTISHVERTADGFDVLVDVPAGVDVDLPGATATIDGKDADSQAEFATAADRVQRTTVIAIDTSDSMAGDRFIAAQAAARAFLGAVPDNVRVGIVTFSSTVDEALEPTTDRDAAETVVDGLSLSKGTALYDGIARAAALSGTAGLRSVLVISDGANTGNTPIGTAIDARESSGVLVDVVALQQTASNLVKLRQIAGEDGQVIDGDTSSLTAAFTAQAETLQRQVDVSVTAPSDLGGTVTIEVDLPSADGDVVARTSVPVGGSAPAIPPTLPVQAPAHVSDAPGWLLYAGVGVFGIGLLVALAMLVPRVVPQMTPAERITTYAASGGGRPANAEKADTGEDALTAAKEAMAGVLRRNQSLDARITQRLDGAGSALKSSEWLLIHAGIFVMSGVVGLVLGRGNIVVGLIFLAVGAVGPWVYLGLRRTRQRRAFDAALPDTLQLMSGSLSAGLSLAQSVDTIVREGTEPVATEFRRVLVETRLGVSLEDAFDGVASRFESRDFTWVVMAIRIQRQVGGNLAELLDTVGATMREREYMRRQVAALAAEGKLSAYVLGGLPPLFLLYLLVANRPYVMPLFTEPMGWVMLTAAGVLLSLGIFTMSRLIKVEV